MFLSLSSCHIPSHSSLVLHFHQPALGCSIIASPYPLPLPSGREAPLPAYPAAALSRPVDLGPAKLPDPGPGGPRHTRTDQWAGPGPWGQGPPGPAGWVPADFDGHSTEGKGKDLNNGLPLCSKSHLWSYGMADWKNEMLNISGQNELLPL